MKHIVRCIVAGAAIVAFAVSCGLVFAPPSDSSGGEGMLALVIAANSGARFLGPPAELPAFSGGQITLRSAGKGMVIERSFPIGGTGDVSGVRIPVPAGEYDSLTLRLTVDHSDAGTDAFPFAKIFAGNAEFDTPIKINKGETAQTPPLEISLSETAVIVPWNDVTSGGSSFILVWNRFTLDPAGRLYTLTIDEMSGDSKIVRYGSRSAPEPFPTTRNLFPGMDACDLSYDVSGGRLYYLNISTGELAYIDDSGSSAAFIQLQELLFREGGAVFSMTNDGNGNLFFASRSSGTGDVHIRCLKHNTSTDMLEAADASFALFPLDIKSLYHYIKGTELPASIPGLVEIRVEDITVIDQYLYVLVNYQFSTSGVERNEGVAAAIPLMNATTEEALEKARYLYSGDNTGLHRPGRICGWGPDAVYITDEEETGNETIYRVLKLQWSGSPQFTIAGELEYQRR
jgi:hypothetical protein